MKLWIDECLSPTLVARAHKRGYWATCNRDRGMLGVSDRELSQAVVKEEAVLVTNDEADFVNLYAAMDLHSGLLILPQARTREALWPLFDAALDYVEERAAARDEDAAGWMLNKRVDIASSDAVTHADLPSVE